MMQKLFEVSGILIATFLSLFLCCALAGEKEPEQPSRESGSQHKMIIGGKPHSLWHQPETAQQSRNACESEINDLASTRSLPVPGPRHRVFNTASQPPVQPTTNINPVIYPVQIGGTNTRFLTTYLHARDWNQIISVLIDSDSSALSDFASDLKDFIMGLAYFQRANTHDYENAQKHFNAITVRQSTTGQPKPHLWLPYVYMGNIALQQRAYIQAANYYQNAQQCYDSTQQLTKYFRMVPFSLSVVCAKAGFAFRCTNTHKKAIDCYLDAIKHAKTDKDTLAAHTSVGNLYQSLGENQSALEHYQESIKLSEKLGNHTSLGWAHCNIGNAYLGLFQKEEALTHLHKSLDLTAKYEPTPNALGRAYNNLGTAYQSLNELDKAGEFYDQALSQAIYGNETQGKARVYGNIANLFLLKKQYMDAIPYYNESLNLSKDECTRTTARHNLGCTCYEYAVSLIENIYSARETSIKFPDDEGKDPLIKYDWHVACLHHRNNHSLFTKQEQQQLETAYKHLEMGNENLRQVLRYHEDTFHTLAGHKEDLSLGLSIFESNSRTFHRLQDCLILLNRPLDALVIAEQSRQRLFTEILLRKQGHLISHRKIKLPLDSKQILEIAQASSHPVICLSYTGSRLISWIFQPHKMMQTVSIPLEDEQFSGKSLGYALNYGLPDHINDKLEMYRPPDMSPGYLPQQLTSREDSCSIDPVLQALSPLSNILVSVCSDLISPGQPRVKVAWITDSYCELLPLLALPVSARQSGMANPTELIQCITPLKIPSLATLPLLEVNPGIIRVKDASDILTVGSPDVPDFSLNGQIVHLKKLPHAEKEALNCAFILKSKALCKKSATKGIVTSKLSRAKLAHFATHGVDNGNGMVLGSLSGTPLNRSDTTAVPAEKVMLTPGEIKDMHLADLDMVMLNSCSSTRGKLMTDSSDSLPSAFLLAGAHNICSTLWRLPDESASLTMQGFLHLIQSNIDSADALTLSNLAIKSVPKYADMIHWSGHQHIGYGTRIERVCTSLEQHYQRYLPEPEPLICPLDKFEVLWDQEKESPLLFQRKKEAGREKETALFIPVIPGSDVEQHIFTYLSNQPDINNPRVLWLFHDPANPHLLDASMKFAKSLQSNVFEKSPEAKNTLLILVSFGNSLAVNEELSHFLLAKSHSSTPRLIILGTDFCNKRTRKKLQNYIGKTYWREFKDQQVELQTQSKLAYQLALTLAKKGLLCQALTEPPYPLSKLTVAACGSTGTLRIISRYLIHAATASAWHRNAHDKPPVLIETEKLIAAIDESLSPSCLSLEGLLRGETIDRGARVLDWATSARQGDHPKNLQESYIHTINRVLFEQVILQLARHKRVSGPEELTVESTKNALKLIMQTLAIFQRKPMPAFFIDQLLLTFRLSVFNGDFRVTRQHLVDYGLLERCPIPLLAEKAIPVEPLELYRISSTFARILNTPEKSMYEEVDSEAEWNETNQVRQRLALDVINQLFSDNTDEIRECYLKYLQKELECFSCMK